MMKYCIYVFLLLAPLLLRAQNNSIEAKAAYILAEESYNKGDYKAALNYLDEAKASMGAANSKMLYLKIQIQLELLKADKSYYPKVVTAINEFERAPDYKTFNEDKILEITKAKLQLRAEQKQQKQQQEDALAEKAAGQKSFDSFVPKSWPVNIPLTELQTKYKQDSLFTARLKNMKDPKFNAVMYYPSNFKFWNWPHFRMPFKDTYFYTKPGLYGIFTRDGIVKGYVTVEMEHDDRDKSKGVSYDSASKEFEALLAKYTKTFAMQPKRMVRPVSEYYQNEDYIWEVGDKQVVLEHHFGAGNTKVSWHVSAGLCVIYK